MLEIRNISKTFNPGTVNEKQALKNISLTLEDGDFVTVIGCNGAGKSTMLNAIAGVWPVDQGQILIDGQEVTKLPEYRRAAFLGRVFQDPRNGTAATMGIEENLALASQIALGKENPRLVEIRIKKVLGLVGMRGAEKKYPVELSIGQCRRVELARAMIGSPPILVLDEITANLDDDCIWDTLHLLNDINQKGTTVIMATHDSQYVNILRRRVITMTDGHVLDHVQKGKYGDVLERDRKIALLPKLRTDLI